ncbi:MAG: mycoredoxin [Mycobacteriaceae bacterium]|nr:mycoredoxin [Mycobacteriaceae bacterium]
MVPIMAADADNPGAGIAAFGDWLDRGVTAALTMYTTTWCGYCYRLKIALKSAGITYTEVDIERDPAAAEFVRSVNGGNQTVPTVKFADGSTLTNPTAAQVRQRLAS